jgi:cytochrome bd-type quinol oxidase subunit 1
MTRSLKFLLFLYLVVFALGLIGLIAVVLLLAPENGAWQSLALFYAAVFVVAFGASAAAGVVLKFFFGSHLALLRDNGITVRQSMFLGLIAVAALLFQSQRLLNFYTIALLVTSFGILEFYFLSK